MINVYTYIHFTPSWGSFLCLLVGVFQELRAALTPVNSTNFPHPSPTSSSEWMWVPRMTCQLRWCNWSFLLPVAASTHHLSSHHFAPDPFSWSRFSEGLSPPCLVSWAIATLTLMCPLLIWLFCINKRWIGMFSQKIV